MMSMSFLSKARIFHRSKFSSLTLNRFYGKIGVLGIPFGEGQRKDGLGQGPKAIRDTGFAKDLQGLGLDVVDFGDVTYDLPKIEKGRNAPSINMRNLEHVAACHYESSQKVASIICDGYKCVCLGGDHSVAIGTIDGHIQAKTDIAVLWIDAHADLNTAATSNTGNVHGMPVALLAKELADYWPYLPGFEWLVPKLSLKNLAYIGLRDVDAYERLIMKKFNITAFGMDDVERYGIHEVIHLALRRIDPNHDRSLHISFDIDSLDPLEAPSTGTPVRGGLTLREGIQIVEDVGRTKRLNCLDIVEVNPALSDAQGAQRTSDSASLIIKSAFGHSRRGFIMPDGTDIPMPDKSTY